MVKTLHIDTWCRDECTIGELSLGLFRCLTLELPWKDNKQYVSCIPSGEYEAKLYQSYKHGAVVLLEGVPGRTFIEIHAGNYTSQIEGCILVGDSIKYLNRDRILDVTNSQVTLRKLLARLPESFTVAITRASIQTVTM
jgi:hypothetical protein